MKFILTNTGSYLGGLNSEYFDKLDKLGFTYTRIPDKNEICDSCIIEINNLDELLKLNKEFGEIILTPSSNDSALLSNIEIYDSYRE